MEKKEHILEMENELQRVANLRMKFMRRAWDEAACDFSSARKVEVTFFENKDIFRGVTYPSVRIALEDQQRKLGEDFISFVGEENMDLLMDVL